MAGGIFFLVVGPSGAGKDSLMDGARLALGPTGRYVFARRTITRPHDAPGEDHEATTPEVFERRENAGQFLSTWKAHGLSYGLPIALLDELEAGRDVIANGSRAVIPDLARRVPRFVVVEVTAPAEVLEARIAGRGRESGDAVRARLARRGEPIPADVTALSVDNGSTLAEGIDRFVEAVASCHGGLHARRLPVSAGADRVVYVGAAHAGLLEAGRVEVSAEGTGRVRARVHLALQPGLLADNEIGLTAETFDELGAAEGRAVVVRAIPPPRSRELLKRKIQGEALDESQYRQVLREIVDGRYTESELTAFLVAASLSLTDQEVLALARARSGLSPVIAWDAPMVVDKHSLGGVPGNRLSPIVVPLIAAHGLLMPKTSSRAITSAAGTADVMEVAAAVDLDARQVRQCVGQARACIVWNGRLNHSVLDDAMNAITRPLGLNSARWSVASILSKKKTAGATHVVVDLPYGPRTKLATRQEALALAALFETTGHGIGLQVRALVTDGSMPIGRGIGPALEWRDVGRVLDNDSAQPADLREKALLFAANILAWDPAVGSVEAGLQTARRLLASGDARRALEKMIDAQGRRAVPASVSDVTHTVCAAVAGRVSAIDGWTIAGIARAAGAPQSKGAGIDLLCSVGDAVQVGDPLYRVHAADAAHLSVALGRRQPGFDIEPLAAARADAAAGVASDERSLLRA